MANLRCIILQGKFLIKTLRYFLVEKNRTPSQRRPYKNTKVLMILVILYVYIINLSTEIVCKMMELIFLEKSSDDLACKVVIAFN